MNLKRTRVPNLISWAAVMGAVLLGGLAVDGRQQTWRPIGSDAYWPQSVRLLDQATFGPTPDLVEHVNDVGTDDFLEEQFEAAMTPYPDLPPMPSNRPADCVGTCQRDNYTMYPLQTHFFKNALYGQDQLRQRVAFALSKIFVVSAQDSNIRLSSWMGPYQQILYADAFGNFRQLLRDVTLSPAMGSYLNVLNNKKVNATTGIKPNENYARELLQLFSIGLVQLNQDGSTTLDSSGAAIPTYDQATVEEFSRVFTGWILAPAFGSGVPNYRDPMAVRTVRGVQVDHDTGSKRLLNGVVIPANLSAEADVDAAIDVIFHHPNVGPFIAKQLIQQLVTSNPSPGYIERVAGKFNEDNHGIRGNLRSVIRNILVDAEARGEDTNPSHGRLTDPVLFVTRVLRAFHAASDGVLASQTAGMGEDLLRAPSVFGFYPPGYRIPGTNGVLGPEFKLHSSASALARVNFVNTVVFGGITANPPDRPLGTTIDLTPLMTLAAQPDSLIAELNGLLLHGSMTPAMRDTVIAAIEAVPVTNALLRVRTAAYLMASSAAYQVEQ
jgi:uncharacterized protein (DUF1800 family)